MEAQTWIIGQIIIDIIIVVPLLWFIRFYLKGKGPGIDAGDILEKTESILSEMRELSQNLDKNLEEKKELTRTLIDQLDDGIQKADKTFKQVQKIMKDMGADPVNPLNPEKDADRIRVSVNALLAKGLSKGEVAQHLGISVGEIDLLLKLQSKTKDLRQ